LRVTIASKTAELEELNAELRLIKEAEEKHREVVAVTALDLEEAKSKLLAAKEAEETATGALAATTAELETLKAEFSAAKETQEKSGEAVILTNKELEELKAELAATKDSEQRFKTAVADYSLKLQGLKLDLEDTTKIAEKVLKFISSFCNTCCLLRFLLILYKGNKKLLKLVLGCWKGEVLCNAVGGIECEIEEGDRARANNVCVSGISQGRAE
jgi:chromosome segregation ATPase